jgi:hypothetical protein
MEYRSDAQRMQKKPESPNLPGKNRAGPCGRATQLHYIYILHFTDYKPAFIYYRRNLKDMGSFNFNAFKNNFSFGFRENI